METVRILLAAYHGEKYIGEMIDSILAQDYPDWQLILSDDQSSDGTASILEDYASRFPQKIRHYRSGMRFGNAQNHFLHLLTTFADAPYVMFCDQDDVWHPDKISKTMQVMKQTEEPGVPTLVHTDLRVVSGDLSQISPSFMAHSGITGQWMQTRQLLVQNVVTGCTMMINRPLAELTVSHLPQKDMLMHDHWIALLASVCGRIGYLDEATIDYRQHGDNSVGAKNVRSPGYILGRLKNDQIIKSMEASFRQADAFLACCADILPEETREMVAAYAALGNRSGFARRITYIRYGFWKIGLSRRIGQLLFG